MRLLILLLVLLCGMSNTVMVGDLGDEDWYGVEF
jgi:hypothetical protein